MRQITSAALALASLVSTGCNQTPNLLRGVSLVPGQTLALDKPIQVQFDGTGVCRIDVDWGDGDTVTGRAISFSNITRTLEHTYSGWRGGKTVTVSVNSSNTACLGDPVRTRFTIAPAVKSIGLAQPGSRACNVPSPRPPDVKPRNLVHITTVPANGFPNGINFGCPLGGCVYDANGKMGSSAPARFPFPGLREFSLVLRVGTQVVQGGTNMQFTTTQSGPLEFCLNDDNLTDNAGGYQVDVSLDQLGPP
jgi:hypothetical protein